MRTHVNPCSIHVFSLVAVALMSACSQPAPAAPPTGNGPRVLPEYSAQGKLSQLTSDANGDGKIDTWAFMDGIRVIRVEIDQNGDGKPDQWQYHKGGTNAVGPTEGEAPGAPDLTLERVERATKFDGKISRREYFTDGQLTRTEEDTNGDGYLDKWETYKDGALATMDIDTGRRGVADRRLVYGPDGAFLRIETDPTGNGIFTPLKQ